MRKLSIITLAAFLWGGVAQATADDSFFQWHNTNVQLLRGWDYKVGSEKRTIATFEHASGWEYGDFYAFSALSNRQHIPRR